MKKRPLAPLPKNSVSRTAGPAWLKRSIFYEVYPQSFLDTNGDGIGDLNGVIKGLDYIASLGCDAIWLNPCWESPFQDAGYDVSDFRRVAPRYGTNSDLIRLFRAAHKKGLRVCLDLVAGHTSSEHAWFKASASPVRNRYSDWYVWTDNIWEDAQGGLKSVSGYSARDGNYVANFFHFQPALNYGFARPESGKSWQLPVNHPTVREVRKEMIDSMRFWLDQGADGFRVDMASSLVKNDPDHVETMSFWQSVREVFDKEYPEAALIAEWSDPAKSVRGGGFHVDFLLHYGSPAYTELFRKETTRDVFGLQKDGGHSFFDRSGKGDILAFLKPYLNQYNATKEFGYIALASGNHDISRLSIGRDARDLEVVFAFLLTMPGIPFLYYGDEIGMAAVNGLISKEGGYGRTASRTPMQWNKSKNAGFSSAPSKGLYLPTDPSSKRPTVEAQEKDPSSLLNVFRKLAALRKSHPALSGEGDFKPLLAEQGLYPFVYLRSGEGSHFLVAVNPSGKSVKAEVSLTIKNPRIGLRASNGAKLIAEGKKGYLDMQKVSYGIFELT